MICKDCNQEYDKWLPEQAIENNLCLLCNEWHWREWKIEERENLKRIDYLKAQGHSEHCACRQVWGDGECECDLYVKGYNPYAWMKGKLR
jgi:hypothetical protein